MINANSWQKPIIFVRTLLGNLRRVVLHILKYRGQFNDDLIAACELEFFFGSLASPFYFLRSSIKTKKTEYIDVG
jgi:hypothetical protein